jgi:hypothetical protein
VSALVLIACWHRPALTLAMPTTGVSNVGMGCASVATPYPHPHWGAAASSMKAGLLQSAQHECHPACDVKARRCAWALLLSSAQAQQRHQPLQPLGVRQVQVAHLQVQAGGRAGRQAGAWWAAAPGGTSLQTGARRLEGGGACSSATDPAALPAPAGPQQSCSSRQQGPQLPASSVVAGQPGWKGARWGQQGCSWQVGPTSASSPVAFRYSCSLAGPLNLWGRSQARRNDSGAGTGGRPGGGGGSFRAAAAAGPAGKCLAQAAIAVAVHFTAADGNCGACRARWLAQLLCLCGCLCAGPGPGPAYGLPPARQGVPRSCPAHLSRIFMSLLLAAHCMSASSSPVSCPLPTSWSW